MDKYNVTVVENPKKHLAGLKVRTSMQNGMTDCPALWEVFGPRMGELLPPGTDCTGFYGVSVMLDAEAFDYWAALEVAADAAIPEGMACIDIPAQPYAVCTVPSIDKLGEAYMYIYGDWPKSQTQYMCDEQAPSFELYSATWQPTDPFEIYIPIKKA